MGFYFRKSFGKGPFRINFSRSGVSYSVGVKGARVNFSNRGTYVNLGTNGIYYRKKISDPNQNSPIKPPSNYQPVTYDQHTITSGNIEEISDTDSQDFINELTKKAGKISFFNWFGIFPLILSSLIFLFIFFSTEDQQITTPVTETKEFIKAVANMDANIRQSADRESQVLGVIRTTAQFELLDESNLNWYKINFNGLDGYVSKKITEKIPVTSTRNAYTTQTTVSLFDKNRILFWTCLVLMILFFIVLLRWLKKIDEKRLLIEIHYDIDEKVSEVYRLFINHFAELLLCERTWQYLDTHSTNNYKYSSGASTEIIRKPLTNISTNKTPLKIFKTNVQIPFLGLINTSLYFFPERIIIKRGNQFGAIMYKHIQCNGQLTRFIESGGVPRDSEVVGNTWRYLNKNGSPDGRFKNNYQIPICRYSEYTFTSSSGLYEKIATSKAGAFDNFVKYIRAIGDLQNRMPENERNAITETN